MLAYTVLERECYIQKKTIYQVKQACSFDFQYADSILDKLIFQGA